MKKIEELNNKNLITVFDTTREIYDELELADEDAVIINAEPLMVEANLEKYLPTYSHARVEECKRLRYVALEYLKKNYYIMDYDYVNNKEKVFVSILDRKKFTQFYDNILKIYNEKWKSQQNNDSINKKELYRTLLEAYLDEKRKVFVIITPTGKEEIGFKKKIIAKEDPRFVRRPEALDEVENEKSETKFYKAFSTLFDLRKEVEKFQEKEKITQGQSIEGLSNILKTKKESVRNYISRIKNLISNEKLPIKLITDNRANYQMFIKITKKLNTKER